MDLGFIDIRTLLVSLTIFTLLVGILLLNYYYSWKERFQGIKRVGIALILLAIVILFEAIRVKLIFSDILAIFTSEGILAAYMLIFLGLSRFKGKKNKLVFDFIILIVSLGYFVIFTLLFPNSVLRISGLSFFIAFYSVRIFLLFTRNVSSYNNILNYSLALSFLIFAMVNILRIILALKFISSVEFEFNNRIQVWYILASIILDCIISLNFIFLLNKETHYIKDRFLSIFAHDIKGPLNSVIGFSDLLLNRSQDLNDEDRTIINLINISGRSGYDLITNMLEWSRFQFKKLELKNKKINIDEDIQELIIFFEPGASIKNINLEYINHSKYQYIYTDVSLLNIVLRNLISNAIKYTPDNGKVSVTIYQEHKNLIISVKDNGVGISDNIINRIQRNQTISSVKGTNEEKGTGLGLLLCNQYLQLLESKLYITRLPEGGSEFSFQLPLDYNEDQIII